MKKIVFLLSMGLLLFSCDPHENPDPVIPSVTTGDVTDITTTTATCGGNVTADGGAAVTARGVCWSTTQNPTTANSKTTNGTGLGTYTSNITGLSPNTTYYVRAYATNANGTAYGEQRTFKTQQEQDPGDGSFTDSRDGNVYSMVTIGSQVWMAENLAYLPSVVGLATGSEDDGHETDPYYYVYGYDGTSVATAKATTNYQTYGVLYNWPAALTVCPPGWHLPSDEEWTELETYLANNGYNYDGSTGGDDIRAKIAISMASATGWDADNFAFAGTIGNTNAAYDAYRNKSGFTALPGGSRHPIVAFEGIGDYGGWSSSTQYDGSYARCRYLSYETSYVTRGIGSKAYGFSVRCVQGHALPIVNTGDVTNITTTTATCSGNVTSDGGSSVTVRGVCWSTSENPTTANSKTTDGSGVGAYSSNLTGLSPNTTYYVKTYATNSKGTAYGEQKAFTTNQAMPTVVTSEVTNITATAATCGGNVTADGGAAVTVRGVCWSPSENPTIANSKITDGTGLGTYASNITGLSPNTTYYVRAYATNSKGTTYGQQRSFITKDEQGPIFGSFNDSRDGNQYKTITIEEQVWMAENLAYLPSVSLPSSGSLSIPYYYVYDYEGTNVSEAKITSNYKTYGVLYNWLAAMSACPTGWHLPSNREWEILHNYLGGLDVAGGKMKEAGTTHWESPNTGATNESGFTALPGGYRDNDGNFHSIGYYGTWWNFTELNELNEGFAWSRNLFYDRSLLNRGVGYNYQGFSVRCLQD